MKNRLAFEEVATEALARAKHLLPSWLPGGSFKGDEYCCSDITGGPGTSLKFNVKKGYGQDFACEEKFGDMIALYAKIFGVSNKDAKIAIEEELGLTKKELIVRPPPETPPPSGIHSKFGAPKFRYRYCHVDGGVAFYIARYENEDGKQFVPWSFDATQKKWVSKAYPAPRPLYKVEKLKEHPEKPILIVEGEKALLAAQKIWGNGYNVITWSGGAMAAGQSDWAPLFGKTITIWPDADEAGLKAAEKIIATLTKHGPVKMINPFAGNQPEVEKGFDIADMEGWPPEKVTAWAKPRLQIFDKVIEKPVQVLPPELPKHNGSGPAVSITVHNASGGMLSISEDMTSANVSTVVSILQMNEVFKNMIWYDEFHGKRYVMHDGVQSEWDEFNDIDLTCRIQSEAKLQKASTDIVRQAAVYYAMNNRKNAPLDWMKTLAWDNEPRIDKFFATYMGADDNTYTAAVSKNFWVSMVARVSKPGCKCDTMTILEGKQGAGKSTAMKIIGQDYYMESNESVQSKDFYQSLQGKFLIEISELDSFHRSEVNAIKRCLSSPVDRMRQSYARYAKDFPRRSIFVGTTNDNAYLSDTTGNRRFWPIITRQIQLNKIEQDRDQLFAEAVARLHGGENWHDIPLDLATQEQSERTQDDVWLSDIKSYLVGKDAVLCRDICVSCLGIDLGRVGPQDTARVGRIIRSLGWRNKNMRDYGGQQVKRWVRGEE